MKVSLSLNKVSCRKKMDDIVMAYEKARGWILFGPITLGDKKSFVSLLYVCPITCTRLIVITGI